MAVDRNVHTLRRFTFGATSELLTEVRSKGIDVWFAEQLNPAAIDDAECDAVLQSHPSFAWGQLRSVAEVESVREILSIPGAPPDSMFQFAKRNVNYVKRMLSRRQVFETMVEFWSEHFNIMDTAGKGNGLLNAYGLDWEIAVIREQALTNFGSLLRATVYHPAMILWLDGEYSRKSSPNENFARELLELYTVTPAGGYTQADIENAARLFSGLRGPTQRPPVVMRETMPGMFRVSTQTFIDVRQQNFGTFRVMGWSGTANSPQEVVQTIDSLLGYLAAHPSTARNVATKLARRYVADFPSETLTTDLARRFSVTGGDTKEMLRGLVAHPEFLGSVGRKVKRPAEDLISMARVLRLRPDPSRFTALGRTGSLAFTNWGFDGLLSRLGHQHAKWPLPDGYPDTEDYWNDSASHVARWYAHQVLTSASAATVAGMTVPQWQDVLPPGTALGLVEITDALIDRLFQAPLAPESRSAVIAAAARTRGVVTEATREATCMLVAFLLTTTPEWVQR
ncbi:MAG: DUF1800 domain-containing protein [Actinomycetota bacterium]